LFGLQPEDAPESSNSRRPLLIAGGFVLLGLALVLLLFGQPLFSGNSSVPPVDLPQIPGDAGSDTSSVASTGALIVGDQAYAFNLADLDGNRVMLDDLEGRPLVLNFWATWCAPCRLEMPHLQRAYEAHANEGLLIIAINQQEQAGQVRSFMNELGLTFTTLLDSEGDVAQTYGANGLPSTYFIDRAGTIQAVHVGILSEEQISGYLDQILQ